MTDEQTILTTEQIEALIPHRFPFLLIDRVVELEPGSRAVAIKNVTANEWFFQGHFPDRPIMPGVLIVEALAQAGSVAALSSDAHKGKLGLFAGIDGMRFRRRVVPGDQLRLEVELERIRGPVGVAKARATVDGERAAEGKLTFALVDLAELG